MHDYLTSPDRRQGFCPIEEAGLGVPDTGPILDVDQGDEPMPAGEAVRRFWLPTVLVTLIGVAATVYACTRG